MDRRSDQVHLALRRDILAGRLAPGDAVPSERKLAEDLGVNRHAVREALKRLEQAGLVRISQGGATRVLDWRDTGGLEVLLDLVGEDGIAPPPELARSVLEMRAGIGVDAARRCAARATAPVRQEIEGLAERAAAAVAAGAPAVDEGYAELWRAVVAGSGNLAYRLGLNSLMGAVAAYPGIAEAVRPADAASIRALGKAIGAASEGDAVAAARALLEPDIDAIPG